MTSRARGRRQPSQNTSGQLRPQCKGGPQSGMIQIFMSLDVSMTNFAWLVFAISKHKILNTKNNFTFRGPHAHALVRIRMHTHTYISTHTYAHSHTHTRIHTYIHTRTHIDTHIHTYTHVHTCLHTYTQTCTLTHTHTIALTLFSHFSPGIVFELICSSSHGRMRILSTGMVPVCGETIPIRHFC